MSSILVITTMVAVMSVAEVDSTLSQQTTPEVIEMYSAAITLHLTIPSPSSSNFDCSKLPDGSHPNNYTDCKSFYVCKNGKTNHFWCDNGTIYDPISRYCISDDSITCTNVTKRKKSVLNCIADGVYPDYENECKSFIVCKRDIKTVYKCPPNMRYDWRRGICRSGQQVSCEVLTCENRPDGKHEDVSSGCRRYYKCEGGVKKEESLCPPGQIFDRYKALCVSYNDGARCSDLHFTCTDLPDGYYPDYKDNCHSFYLCIGGHLKSFYCPPGLIFSPKLLACDLPSRVVCKPTPESFCVGLQDGIFPDYRTDCHEFVVCENETVFLSGVCPQGKSLDPTTSTCQPYSMMNCQPVTDVQCGHKVDGIYPDVESGCNAYYLCVKGKVLVTSFCPEGTSFHTLAGICLPSAIVSCGGAVAPHSNSCKGRIGLYPDYDTGCRTYHVCAYGPRATFTCPNELAFDAELQTCSPANSTSCIAPIPLATFRCPVGNEDTHLESGNGCRTYHQCWRGLGVTYSCPYGQKYDSVRRMCSRGTGNSSCSDGLHVNPTEAVSQVIQWQFNCTAKRNGVHNSEQCGMFHICVNNKTFSYICPPGKVFDINTLSCQLGTCRPSGVAPPWFEDTFTCDNKRDGMYPDVATYCRRYYVCENGKASSAYCREGEVFDEQTMMCVDASSANCTSVNAVVSRVKPTIRKISIRLQKSESPPTNFRCPIGETGFFPDYQSGCRLFHICFRKLRKTYTCPSVLLFNPVTKSCDLPENVKCRRPPNTNQTPPTGVAVPINCTSEPNGRIADHDSGCRKYYACVGGKLITFNCPEGTYYNEAEGYCRYQASCRKGTSPTHAHGVPNRYVFSCVGVADGFYPDYARDCHVFYRCVRGKKFSHYCKQGLLFDPATGICQFEDNVVCSPPPAASVEIT